LQRDVAYIGGAKGALAVRKQSVLEELKSLMDIVEKAKSIEEVNALPETFPPFTLQRKLQQNHQLQYQCYQRLLQFLHMEKRGNNLDFNH